MKNIVVFASGSGSNFQAILDAIQNGQLQAKVSGLIASKEGIGAIDRAKKAGVPVAVLHESAFTDANSYASALLEQVQTWKADLIVLAGFLRKIPASLLQNYRGQIINIHPSLLPKYGGKGFFGLRVHQAVLAAGETQSGCTVHRVTEEYDEGEILGQRIVQVEKNDTPERLQQRVLAQEHQILPIVISNLLTS